MVRLRVFLPESTFDGDSPAATFRVGRGDTPALRFEGESAKFASWEHAECCESGGTAFVNDLASSNGTYVDGALIAGPTPLRLGTVVQIGRAGPRLEVLALAPAVARPVPMATYAPPDAPDIAPEIHLSPPRRRRNTTLQWAGLAGIGLAVLVAALIASRAGSDRGHPAAAPAVQSKPQATKKQTAQSVNTAVAKSPESIPASARVAAPLAQQPLDRASAAYRLVVADDPRTKTTWPLFGAVVVGTHTLLTRATSAAKLAEFMQKEWPLAVMKPSGGARQAIREVRIHAAFQQADAVEQLFFDEALLYTDGPLADLAELAEADELNLELGQPLTCIALDHDREPLNRFQELNPAGHRATVFKLTNLPGEADGPRLLLARGDLNDKYFGSPVSTVAAT